MEAWGKRQRSVSQSLSACLASFSLSSPRSSSDLSSYRHYLTAANGSK